MVRRINLKVLSILGIVILQVVACRDRPSNAGVAGPTPQRQESSSPSEIDRTGGRKRQERELKLFPVDDASQDRSFEHFRNALLAAARNRDSPFILGVLDQHILNTLGGSGGIEEFKAQWKLDTGADELWNTLITVLTNGGSFSNYQGKKQFCAPYVSSKWEDVVSKLPSEADPSEYAAIIQPKVDLRAEPASDSSVIRTLSYDVVRVLDASRSGETSPEVSQLVKVQTLTGVEGYVNANSIRRPSDYRACFNKVDSKWVMTLFAAGD